MIAFADMYFYIKEQKLKGRGTCPKSDIEVNRLSYPDSSANYKLKENHLAVRNSNYKGEVWAGKMTQGQRCLLPFLWPEFNPQTLTIERKNRPLQFVP